MYWKDYLKCNQFFTWNLYAFIVSFIVISEIKSFVTVHVKVILPIDVGSVQVYIVFYDLETLCSVGKRFPLKISSPQKVSTLQYTCLTSF